MNKKDFSKIILFTTYLILIVTIVCLWNKEPATPEIEYFVSEEDVEKSLPDYPTRPIYNQKWNKGVNIINDGNKKYAPNKFIIIEPSDSISIYGWAIDNDRNCPISNIYMEANNQYIKGIYGLPKQDIKRDLGIKGSSCIGFIFHFDRKLLQKEDGSYCENVKFHLIDKEEKMIISDVEYDLIYRITRISDNITKNESLQKGMVFERVLGGVLDNENKTILSEKRDIHISGWVADIENKLPLKNIFISVGNSFYMPLEVYKRNDVDEVFNLSVSNCIGFKFSIPKYILQDENGNKHEYIQFYLEDKNGIVYEIAKYFIK